MLEKSESILKIICLALAGLLLFQVSRLAVGRDPLKDVNVPIPPSAPARENTQATEIASPPVPPGMPRMPGMSGMPGGSKVSLPGTVQASVDKITQSEILGPVVRPPPMALLGIAGKDAMVRGPNGKTGLLREGGELGGVKLLRIGTNRVLVEHEGQEKELTIFKGFGSETLMSKGKEKQK